MFTIHDCLKNHRIRLGENVTINSHNFRCLERYAKLELTTIAHKESRWKMENNSEHCHDEPFVVETFITWQKDDIKQ